MDMKERSPVEGQGTPPFAREADDVLGAIGSNAESGLSTGEATARRRTYGPNEITAEEPPSTWAIAAALGRGDVAREIGEIGRQDRRRHPDAHWLTSSEIASPGCTW